MTGAGITAGCLVLVSAAALRSALAGHRRASSSARLLGARGIPTGEPLGPGTSRPGGAGPGTRLLRTPAQLESRLRDAGLAVSPGMAWTVWLGGGVAFAGWGAAAAGPGAGTMAAAAVVFGPCLGWRLLRHRGEARLEAALPAAVDAVAAGLRSGASLRQALAESARATPGPLGAELAAVATAVDRGAGVVAALEGWASRAPTAGVRLVVAALCLGAETGGAAAQAIDAVAATLRQRLAAQAEARALATQARVSAAVIVAAPFAFCALSAATDPRSARFLLRTPTGLLLLAAGLSLDALGALWMARLTRLDP